MGCSSSRDAPAARGDIEMRTLSLPAARAAERRHSLPPLRSSSLGLCRCRDDDGAAHSPLLLDGGAAAAEAVAAPRIASRAPTAKASPPGARKPGPGLVAVLEDHLWRPASCPSGWCPGLLGEEEASSSSSLPTVLQQQQLLPGFFDPAILSSFQEPKSPEEEEEEEKPFDVDVATVPHSPSAIARDSPQVASGLVRSRVHEFQEQQRAAAQRRRKQQQQEEEEEAMAMAMAEEEEEEEEFPLASPAAGGKVVIYFTSIRGVRRTFEDGRAVRAILRAYRVRVDERDVSMHAAFKDELRGLLLLHGHGHGGASFKDALPRVFVVFGDGDGERWGDMGGADEVRALHEAGELGCALAGCGDTLPPPLTACAGCGDMRFLPCGTCSGCCRVFACGEFLRCPDCNENGLVRCPLCCY